MNLFLPGKEYLDYLTAQNKTLLTNSFQPGILLRLNGFIYFVPVSEIDDSDYSEDGKVRNSTPAILRMLEKNTARPIGKILFSNMFPVPYKEVNALALYTIAEDKIPLFEKQITYISSNQSRINKAAQRLYKQKIRHYNQKYLEATADFEKMEKECLLWEKGKYGKHYNRFPDSSFFIENPNQTGISSYYLMNKKTKIAKISLDNITQNILSIEEFFHPEFAPPECIVNGTLTPNSLSSWFKGRGIPSWRDGLDDFLNNAGIKTETSMLNRAFGLSLSDQYWLNPSEAELDWDDINFFDHDFDNQDYIEAGFEDKMMNKDHVNFFTPDNTTDGMLKKAWVSGENGERYLLKGSYRHSGFEPFCEVLASCICDVLDVSHAVYSINHLGHSIVSQCRCFIDKDTELVTAYAVLKNAGIHFNEESAQSIYQKYIHLLKQHGITTPETDLTKMFILDYLIVNTDRHTGNFGIIRNVNTLDWTCIAPVYDSGQAMYSQNKVFEMNFHSASGTFFHLKNIDFEQILDIVMKNEITVDKEKLYQVAKEWRKLLLLYQEEAGISQERINACYEGLLYRIHKLCIRL